MPKSNRTWFIIQQAVKLLNTAVVCCRHEKFLNSSAIWRCSLKTRRKKKNNKQTNCEPKMVSSQAAKPQAAKIPGKKCHMHLHGSSPFTWLNMYVCSHVFMRKGSLLNCETRNVREYSQKNTNKKKKALIHCCYESFS